MPALVAQWKEHWFAEPEMGVQFPPRAQITIPILGHLITK